MAGGGVVCPVLCSAWRASWRAEEGGPARHLAGYRTLVRL